MREVVKKIRGLHVCERDFFLLKLVEVERGITKIGFLLGTLSSGCKISMVIFYVHLLSPSLNTKKTGTSRQVVVSTVFKYIPMMILDSKLCLWCLKMKFSEIFLNSTCIIMEILNSQKTERRLLKYIHKSLKHAALMSV